MTNEYALHFSHFEKFKITKKVRTSIIISLKINYNLPENTFLFLKTFFFKSVKFKNNNNWK